MRERKRQANPGWLDPPPPRRQVPHQQRQADLEPRLADDRPERVGIGDPSAGTTQQRRPDLRPRPDALGELVVEQPEPGGPQRSPRIGGLDQLLGARKRWLQQVTGTGQLARRPVADPGLERDQSVENQQPRTPSHRGEQRPQVARPDLRAQHPDGGNLAGGDAHPDVELLRKIVVRIEQVGVERRGFRRSSSRTGGRRPPYRSGPGVVRSDRHQNPLRFSGREHSRKAPTRRVYGFRALISHL